MLSFIDPTQSVKTPKGRPLGGWDDDTCDDENMIALKPANKLYTQQSNSPTVQSTQPTSSNPNSLTTKAELIQVTEDFLNIHDYENRLINSTIGLGGVRLKQTDQILEDFVKAAESLSVSIIGSILIYRARSEGLQFVSKARILYDIEILAKKLEAYRIFFKQSVVILKEIRNGLKESSPSNLAQLRSILDSIICFLEDSSHVDSTIKTPPKTVEEHLLNAPTNKVSAFSFIKPTQETSNANQTSTSTQKRSTAFNFIHQSKNQTPTTNNVPIEPVKKETEIKAQVFQKDVSFAAVSVNNGQNNANTTKKNVFEELNSIDFNTDFTNNQQTSKGSRLDALWSYQNYMDGALDITAELAVQAEKKRQQQQEIEDKFFGFVSVSASLV